MKRKCTGKLSEGIDIHIPPTIKDGNMLIRQIDYQNNVLQCRNSKFLFLNEFKLPVLRAELYI